MKKKISLLGLVLILVLSFTGCSKSNTTEYDAAELEQYASFLVQNFSSMTEEDFDNFENLSELELDLTLLQVGLPVSGEDFLSMIDAWKAGEEECGALVGIGSYETETTSDGVTLILEANFEERDGTLEFVFDEDLNIESLTVNAEYSTIEILQKAGLNTVLGMGTVFVVLIFLSFVIWLLKFIPVLEKKFRKNRAEETQAEVQTEAAYAAAEEEDVTDDTELAAVIAAAVAAAEGTSAGSFIVRSIKRRKSNKWN